MSETLGVSRGEEDGIKNYGDIRQERKCGKEQEGLK